MGPPQSCPCKRQAHSTARRVQPPPKPQWRCLLPARKGLYLRADQLRCLLADTIQQFLRQPRSHRQLLPRCKASELRRVPLRRSQCGRASALCPSLRASLPPQRDRNTCDRPGPSCVQQQLLPPRIRARNPETARALSLVRAPSFFRSPGSESCSRTASSVGAFAVDEVRPHTNRAVRLFVAVAPC